MRLENPLQFILIDGYLRQILESQGDPQGMICNQKSQVTGWQIIPQITDQISQEVVLDNYGGHGSIYLRAHEGIVSNADIADLSNDQRHPVMGLMTCLNDYFVTPNGFRSLTVREAPSGLNWSRGHLRPNGHD